MSEENELKKEVIDKIIHHHMNQFETNYPTAFLENIRISLYNDLDSISLDNLVEFYNGLVFGFFL